MTRPEELEEGRVREANRKINKNLTQKIDAEMEIISEVFRKWASGEKVTALDKSNYYHSKLIVSNLKREKIALSGNVAGDAYCHWLNKYVSEEI